jgi:tetratricopeptide (TPR) repeat protein
MDATERCEKALAAHLLVVAERAYEFANDLIREVLYASMPTPTSITMHRRAADLQVDRPERVGAHAAAAGDWKRAAKAWLIAGEQANQRVAFADAEALLTRAIEATAQVADDEVAGRAHLARGRARDAMTSYVGALGDYETAAHVAKRAGDRRLEMLALRELGGDVPVALSTSVTQCTTRLRTGLALAEELGDRAMEADILSRLAVIASNRLLFTDSLAYGHRAVRAARASGDSHVIALALDGLKTGYAYLGEIQALAPIVVELEPLLRRHHLTWLLPWTIQESAFPAIAEGRWDDALMRLTEALDLNRRSGYVAYEGWFVGNIGWVHRLRGDLDAALDFGRQAVHLTRNLLHPWGCSAACSQYGTTLLAAGQRAAAVEMLMLGRGYAEYEGAEAYLLNCLGPLAEATGDPDVLARADRLAAGVRVPTGSVWMLGAESAIAMGRAWLASGEPTKALAIVTPLIDAAGRTGWGWVREAAEQVAAACEQSAVPQI